MVFLCLLLLGRSSNPVIKHDNRDQPMSRPTCVKLLGKRGCSPPNCAGLFYERIVWQAQALDLHSCTMFVKISRCVPDVPCVPAIWIHSALRVTKFFQCLHSILLSPHLIGGFRVLLYQPKATTEYPFDLFDVLPLALRKKIWAALAFCNLEGRCEIFTGDIISQWSCTTFFLPSKCFDPLAMGASENSPNESRSTMPSMAPPNFQKPRLRRDPTLNVQSFFHNAS